jgi:glutamate synthase domain-containing protein 3
VDEADDISNLKSLVEAHYTYTGSVRAKEILSDWDTALPKFVKVVSREYEEMLAELARERSSEQVSILA